VAQYDYTAWAARQPDLGAEIKRGWNEGLHEQAGAAARKGDYSTAFDFAARVDPNSDIAQGYRKAQMGQRVAGAIGDGNYDDVIAAGREFGDANLAATGAKLRDDDKTKREKDATVSLYGTLQRAAAAQDPAQRMALWAAFRSQVKGHAKPMGFDPAAVDEWPDDLSPEMARAFGSEFEARLAKLGVQLPKAEKKQLMQVDLGDRIAFLDPDTRTIVGSEKKGNDPNKRSDAEGYYVPRGALAPSSAAFPGAPAAPGAEPQAGPKPRPAYGPTAYELPDGSVVEIYRDARGQPRIGKTFVAAAPNPEAPADQRARIMLGFMPSVDAVQKMETLEKQTAGGRGPFNTPLGQSAGPVLASGIPVVGKSLAKVSGSDGYKQYVSASKTFEQSMLPVFSGAAVTESEGERFVLAQLPSLGDSPVLLKDKARRRRQIVNVAAVMLGATVPFPEEGIPDIPLKPLALEALQKRGVVMGAGVAAPAPGAPGAPGAKPDPFGIR
jgi:hypothetical protein